MSPKISENNNPQSTLPPGWQWVKLGEVCRVFSGSSAPQEKKYFESGKYPFVRVQDLGRYGRTNNLVDIKDYLNDVAIEELKLKKAEKGTILFPKSGAAITTNNRAILGIDAFIVSHLAALKPKEGITDAYFVYYWLCLTDMIQYMENPGYPSLKLSIISRIPVALPSLPEQKRIAAKLQGLMQEVEGARTACEKQLEAAQALPAAYLQEVFESKEAKKWERKMLGEMCNVISKGTTPTTYGYSFVSSGIPFLRAEDIAGGPIDFSSVEFHITKETHDFLNRSKLHPGDLLITIAGSLGRVGYIPEDAPESNCNQAVAFARIDSQKTDVEFLCHVLQSPNVISPFTELKVGGTIQNLNLAQVRSIEVPFPPLPVQRHIAAELKEKMVQIAKLRKSTEKQFENINALPQAILRKVFRRKL